MSLKNEIEKLVALERSKIKAHERNLSSLREKEVQSFHALASLLRQLESELDAKYFSFKIGEQEATINIQVNLDAIWDVGYWVVCCRSDTAKEGVAAHKSGFWLDRLHWRTKESIGGLLEFEDETEVLTFMVGEISRRIAHHQEYMQPKQ